jgi:hypothetical protein
LLRKLSLWEIMGLTPMLAFLNMVLCQLSVVMRCGMIEG